MPRSPKPPRPHTFIYASDIKAMMGRGRSLATAYRILRKIRERYGKPPKSEVTVEEYCKYMQHKKYEIQHIIDCIRRDEELAYYATMKNPPRHGRAVIEMREEDMF